MCMLKIQWSSTPPLNYQAIEVSLYSYRPKKTNFERSCPSSIINILVSIVPGRRKAIYVPFDWWILYCLRQWYYLRLGPRVKSIKL